MPDAVNILAVDDVEESLATLEDLLRRDGVRVLTARSGEEALTLLQSNEVAVALVDVLLPGMDGFELAEKLRRNERTHDVPIIFISGAAADARRVFHGYDLGAVDFLFKPLEARVLWHKVDVFVELYRQRRAIADTLRLSEELLAIASHDLRNPLNAILMSADLLERRRSEEDVLKAAARIRRSGVRMTRMLDDLLDLTRARMGSGIPIEKQRADVGKIARKVKDELDAGSTTPRIHLRAEGEMELDGDPARLEQVFSNLMANALRHGTPGGEVHVSLHGSQDQVRLLVANGGVIPASILPQIFEPFRARGRSARPEGLGLGLYIASQIIQAHGGKITLRSTASEGTVVEAILPRS